MEILTSLSNFEKTLYEAQEVYSKWGSSGSRHSYREIAGTGERAIAVFQYT
jgi:hypothetical protein